MNRLEEYFRPPPEPVRHDDYFEIEGHYDTYAVSRAMAADVVQRLGEQPTPRWIVLRDLSGARHQLLAAQIYRISESTAAQRAAQREFNRARREEARQDRKNDHRPWEDDD
jgi:hypothetical protein